MNYNIEYEKKSFMKAIDYIKENNLYRRGESNYDLWLIDFIKSTVKSAMHKYKSAGVWSSWSSCGGVTLVLTSDNKATEGFDIIDVNITVEPNFENSDYVTLKIRDEA